MTLSQRQKFLLRLLGYPLLGLVVFVLTLQLTFPYQRAVEKAGEALRGQFDLQVGDVSRGLLPGNVSLENVILKSVPKSEGDVPTVVLIDRLDVSLGLLALIGQTVSVDVNALIDGGEIQANVALSQGEVEAEVAAKSLPLESIPGLPGAVGLPMKGGLNANVELRILEERWDQATGFLLFSCPSCTVGDGVAKIKPQAGSSRRRRSSAIFAAEGLTVPELNLGDFQGEITIEDGRANIASLGAQSPDGDLEIHGQIDVGQSWNEAKFDQACMKFRLSDDLKRREAKFGNMPLLLGAPVQDDGYSNLQMRGRLSAMRMVAANNCENDGASERVRLGGSRTAARRRTSSRNASARTRPTLEVTETKEDGARGGRGGVTGDMDPAPPRTETAADSRTRSAAPVRGRGIRGAAGPGDDSREVIRAGTRPARGGAAVTPEARAAARRAATADTGGTGGTGGSRRSRNLDDDDGEDDEFNDRGAPDGRGEDDDEVGRYRDDVEDDGDDVPDPEDEDPEERRDDDFDDGEE